VSWTTYSLSLLFNFESDLFLSVFVHNVVIIWLLEAAFDEESIKNFK